MKTAIITGISGQDGACLSKLLIDKNYAVVGLVRSSSSSLWGLRYLGTDSQVIIEECDFLEFFVIVNKNRFDFL